VQEFDIMPDLMRLSGLGPILAAIILSEIKDINRFSKIAKLARYAGCAPRTYGSGGKFKHYPNHRGNRKLNWAIHRMTLSQLGNRGNPITKAYYQKKLKMGKTKKQAFVACKRQLIKMVYQTLKKETPYQSNN
jgi:transposase